MGLIRAAVSSIGSVFGDQWLDVIKCEDMNNNLLMVKKSDKKKRNIISKNSRIVVNPGQLAIIVDNGTVLDATAEPGTFTFDSSSSPSFFGGDFGPVFKEMWERFKFGGGISKQQAVYFFNTKEIIDNKFGTVTPIPYSDWGHPTFNPRTQALYGMAVRIRMHGKYTFRITNPFALLNNIAGTAEEYYKDDLVSQMTSEFMSAMQSTLNLLGTQEYKIPALDIPSRSESIIKMMHDKSFDEAIKLRGIEILSIAVSSVSFDDESQEKIDRYELSDPLSQNAYLAHSQGEALKNAASNPSGAGSTMMGMGLGFGAMGINPTANMNQNYQGQMNTGAAINEAVKGEDVGAWTCSCGTKNTGKFCSECGKKAEIKDTWTCSCGSSNTGKFCSECGKKREIEGVCGKCGAVLKAGTKFCGECGEKV